MSDQEPRYHADRDINIGSINEYHQSYPYSKAVQKLLNDIEEVKQEPIFSYYGCMLLVTGCAAVFAPVTVFIYLFSWLPEDVEFRWLIHCSIPVLIYWISLGSWRLIGKRSARAKLYNRLSDAYVYNLIDLRKVIDEESSTYNSSTIDIIDELIEQKSREA